MPLSPEAREELKGIVDLLVLPTSETFDPETAVRLKDILLLDGELVPAVQIRFSVTNIKEAADHRQEAAKFKLRVVGTTPLPPTQSREVKSVNFRMGSEVTCGNWKFALARTWLGKIAVCFENRFSDSEKRDIVESYALLFDRKGAPQKLLKSTTIAFKLSLFKDRYRIAMPTIRLFKRPAPRLG